MQTADLIIQARWIAPVEPEDACLWDHCLVVADGRIAAVLPVEEAVREYQAAETVTLDRHLLIPGLVNAHTHAAMTLFRGMADDLPLEEWLNGHIWPAERRWVEADFIADGTRLALAEMIRSGTTCFNDMYFFPDVVAECAEAAGLRACVGLIVIDFPTVWAASGQEYLDKGLAVHDRFRHSALVTTAFAPHAPYTVSDGPLEKIQVLADELDLPVHMHVHETAAEVAAAEAKEGARPLARLARLGLLGPRLVAVHMTELDDEEIAAVAEQGAHVVHCPESNLKLASGFCPAARLDRAGVNLALGTDGAASNNDLDMIGEMRSAALLAKGVAGDPTALPAHRVLRMATLNGARALGLGEVCGSLRPGKSADVVAVRLDGPGSQPVYDPVAQLVYSAGRDQVSDVWVAGRRLLQGGALLTLDEGGAVARARAWGERIAAADRPAEGD